MLSVNYERLNIVLTGQATDLVFFPSLLPSAFLHLVKKHLS
jgi:hypothetical protein